MRRRTLGVIPVRLTPLEVKRIMWHFALGHESHAHMLPITIFLAVNTPTDDEVNGKVRLAVASVLRELGYDQTKMVNEVTKGGQSKFLKWAAKDSQ